MFENLAFTSPRSEAAVELSRLLDAHAELEAKLDLLAAEENAAGERVAQASAALVALERASLSGEVPAGEVSTAEAELVKAKSGFAQPWHERRSAIVQAITADRGRVGAYAKGHFAELVAEVAEDAFDATTAVNAAAERLVEAAHERGRQAGRLDALVAAVRGRSEYGDVALSRADAVVREAERLLSSGGEAAPELRAHLMPGVHVDEPEPATAA